MRIFIYMYIAFLVSGCTSMGLGTEKTYCEERGLDYADAGTCMHPIDGYYNREKALRQAYKDFTCEK